MTELQFEPLTLNDLDKIKDLTPNGWGDIAPFHSYYLNSNNSYPLKAMLNEKIVGIGTSIVFEKTCWLAHIIVSDRHRNQGIGSEIVNRLLVEVKNKGIETCSLIATELGKPIYIKYGFKEVGEYTFMIRTHAPKNVDVSKKIISFKENYRSAIYDLDQKISGENRQSLLSTFLSTSLVYVENGYVLGYYIPDLQEGPIYAFSNEAGIELMKVKYATADKAVLPSKNLAGIEFLKQYGFTITETKGIRMILGNSINWQPDKVFSRIGGNFG